MPICDAKRATLSLHHKDAKTTFRQYPMWYLLHVYICLGVRIVRFRLWSTAIQYCTTWYCLQLLILGSIHLEHLHSMHCLRGPIDLLHTPWLRLASSAAAHVSAAHTSAPAPIAYKTHKVLLSYGFAQLSKPCQWGWWDTYPSDLAICCLELIRRVWGPICKSNIHSSQTYVL